MFIPHNALTYYFIHLFNFYRQKLVKQKATKSHNHVSQGDFSTKKCPKNVKSDKNVQKSLKSINIQCLKVTVQA